MDKFRVWFGFGGEVYAGEDQGCPSEWRGSGCYDIFEDKEFLLVADIWCKEEHIEDKVLELIDKEFDVSLGGLEIVKYARIDTEDDDDPDEYIDDWHVIKEDGCCFSFSKKLTMANFAKIWDGGKNAHPGDVYFTVEGRLIEIL